jgi:glycerol-3-phosphate acyltransferase PlsY
MNDVLITTLALVLCYLIGSLPSAFLIGKLRKGVDIRRVGSHNMGAMNTFYSVGFWWGMIVLLMDIGKGAAAAAAAWWLTKPIGLDYAMYMQLAGGVAAVLGHNFSVFLKFKGGKGGASCIGILVYIMPWGIPFYLAIFLLMLLITRFPTLSYSIAFLCFPVLAAFMYHNPAYVIFSFALLIIPVIRYIPRIFEMKKGAGKGGWKRVAMRKSLKDRF